MNDASSLDLHQTVVPELKLIFASNDLIEILGLDPFVPERIIDLIRKQYPDTYEKDVGVREKYTLEEHTLMVMKQFEKYFWNKILPWDIDLNMFRLILALHDIGKPEAISKGGKHLQHKYTQIYIESLFEALHIDERHTKLALVLTSGDPIGKYLTSKIDATETRKAIEEMANNAEMPISEFFKLLCIFYKSDAWSYTENAGGLKSLDSLFNFNEKGRNLAFAPDTQEKIDQLGF